MFLENRAHDNGDLEMVSHSPINHKGELSDPHFHRFFHEIPHRLK